MTVGRRIRMATLIDRAVEIVKGFNPATQTVDSYADDALGGHPKKTGHAAASESDFVFLKQVLYGCVRYKEALRVFLKHYYNDMAGSILHGDITFYTVLGFLLLFRLDELGFSEFRRLTSSDDPVKIAQLLKYLTDWSLVEGQLTQDWLTVFDLTYINDVMVGGLRRASGAIEECCKRLAIKAFSLSQAREEAKAKMGLAEVPQKSLTVPRPFNLTKPNTRKVPEPIKIEHALVKGSGTDHLYRTNLEEVESGKRERLETMRRQTLQKYQEAEEAGRGEFRFHETRNTLDALRDEEEKRTASELQFNKRFTTEVPSYPEEGSQVRLNAAAILREDALLKRKQDQDAKLIKSFESELRDSTEFYMWQSVMRERDATLRKEQVERLRVYAKASQQAARDSLELQRAAKGEIARRMKMEKGAMKEQREAEEDLAITMNQRLVKEVAKVRKTAPKDAVNRVLDDKKCNREQLCHELEEARKAKRREAEEEHARRKDAVLKLKEQEIHEPRVKVFDPTESAGLGFLDEMSLVETKGRLEANARRRAAQETNRRKEIIFEKAEREADLRERLKLIQERRTVAKKANRDAARERKEREAAQAKKDRFQRGRNKTALMEDLGNRRVARETELATLAEEEERRIKAAMYLGRAAAAVEENNHKQLIHGKERDAVRRQREAREAAEKYQTAMKEDRRQFEEHARRKEARKKRLYALKQREFEAARERLMEEQREEMRGRQENFKLSRAKAKELRQKIMDYNPYADAINRESIDTARLYVASKKGEGCSA